MFEDYGDLLTIEELCDILSVGKNTAYELLRTRKIKSLKIGRSWKTPKKSVEEYIIHESKLSLPLNET